MSHATSLQALLEDIHDPAILRAQLTLLDSWLAYDRQFEAHVVVAVLAERMGELARAASAASAQRERCRALGEDVAEATRQVAAAADTALALVSAVDMGSALYDSVNGLHKSVRACLDDVENILLQLHEFDFDELAMNHRDLHSIIRRMDSRRGFAESTRLWLMDKFRQIETRMQAYAGEVAKRQLLPMAAALYGRYRNVATEAAGVHTQWKRARNPLSPLGPVLEDMEGSIDRLGAHLHRCINALARHEEMLLVVQSRTEGFLVLCELMQRDAAR
ncbi:MAG: hypothetical protein CVV05_02235 [Gammaproteobacteria bacterium HGW-Gammaproteobacteria-1]|jgi:hypothetical protein|nr:MAG: hypothetical protein CVV05_02235 [Gammaproteobacteria bacterium HGW-Gammaproteobacteria-1]